MTNRERIEIAFDRFTCPEGKPTCAVIWGIENCKFLRVGGMCGRYEICGITGEQLNRDSAHAAAYAAHAAAAAANDDGMGFLRPVSGCIMWEQK